MVLTHHPTRYHEKFVDFYLGGGGKAYVGMVQAWVAQKLLNVTFKEYSDVRFYKYLRRLLVRHVIKKVFKA